jgi:type II secretory pathway component GspD/PulD (secretin)
LETPVRILLAVFLFIGAIAVAEPIKSLEFRNQDVQDILLTLGELNQVSIVPDETVDGKASYVFANMEFDQALRLFLDSFKLTAVVKSGVYYISKVSLTQNISGNLSISASDVPIRSVIRILSTFVGKTILYDNLPSEPATINAKDATIEEILAILIAKYPEFKLESQAKYYYIRSKAQSNSVVVSNGENSAALIVNEDRYSWKVDKGRFKDLLIQLFNKGGKQFVLLMDRDQTIDNLNLQDLSFDEALKALLLLGNGDYSATGNTYTIFEVQRKDLLRRYLTNVILPFEHISTADFTRLLPPGLNSNASYKLDDKANKLILSGSNEEIKPIWDFFTLVDRPSLGSSTIRVDLQYLKSDEFIPLLPSEYTGFSPQPLPAKNGILITLPEGKRAGLESFRQLVDRALGITPIRLRYLKADELLAKLPPSVVEANLAKTNDPSLVFFKGNESLLQTFRRDLEFIDQPRPLLRYDILVLQFEEGRGINIETNLTALSDGDSNTFTGNIGKLLGFSFDVVGNFGIGFGMDLSAALTESNAKVVADTTLSGISGEKISFQNTNTTRYISYEIDPTTGKPYTTGTVHELSSGLILNLEGWISADKMITLKVDTTLSKQTASTSSSDSSSDSTPSTSEKKISTLVRTTSGKPLVIGGLKQEDTSISIEKTPILGDIPLLGWLFQKRVESLTRTEFSIYIVPILETPEWENLSEADKAFSQYKRFHAGAQ